ncbi:MAG: phage major capsid protein [Sulfuricaulis sp.]|nr:phage major capsid protein [Sulfuricaulis sp.]
MPTGTWANLHDERARLLDEAEGIFASAKAEGRSLTDDERTRDDVIAARLETITEDLAREERIKAQAINAIGPTAHDPALTRITGVNDRAGEKPWGFDTFGMGAEQFIAKHPSYYIPENHALHPVTRFQNAADGEFLKAVFMAAKGRGTDARLLFEAAAQGAGEFVGADGGFLLPKPSTERLMLRMSKGEILSRVQRNLMTVGNSIDVKVIAETSRATGSRHGAVQGYRLGEGDTITASRPKFANLEFKLKKYAALGYASDELLQDTSLMGRLIFDAFGDELRFMAEDDIINGTGVGMPQGILNATALVTVDKETGQAAASIVYENLSKMWARCNARCRPNCVWIVNQDIEPALDTLAKNIGTGGVEPNFVRYAEDGVLRIKGRPTVAVEYAATLGTKGDIILTDLSEYWFWDKGDPQQASSIHVAFTTDEQAFRVIYRADGRCSWIAPLTPYKGGSNTQSCCVALATRA